MSVSDSQAVAERVTLALPLALAHLDESAVADADGVPLHEALALALAVGEPDALAASDDAAVAVLPLLGDAE